MPLASLVRLGRPEGTGRRSRFVPSLLIAAAAALGIGVLRADGPADNIPTNVRRMPPPGVPVPPEVRASLSAGVQRLEAKIESLRGSKDPRVAGLLPDVIIFARAVRDALEFDEFFDPKEFASAGKLLEVGEERAAQLAAGKPAWPTATGLVVRGYVSELDGSVQPYGMVVPTSWRPGGAGRHRLDLWFHGRQEKMSEVNFLAERMSKPGQFTPADTFVLHPYGRYCNANKFAGEVDPLEALADVQRRYPIDDDRISVRGFSMGGASAWHFAVHQPTRWFAANPGAGFSETPDFLKVFQKEPQQPTWWERKLWRLHDGNEWAENLGQCPTIAYSGELDSQKQAADVMAKALSAKGIELVHLIGPGTKHQYHPESARQVEERMAALARRGRERVPRNLRFVTYTLRYDRCGWLRIDGMTSHWEPARVEGGLPGPNLIRLETSGVTGLSLEFGPGEAPFAAGAPVAVMIDRGRLNLPGPRSDRSWSASFHWDASGWKIGPAPVTGLVKKHQLQGPIDDAFMGPFLFVLPSGPARNPALGAWVKGESERALVQWRRQFRGRPRVKKDVEVTAEDIARFHLVLWGDPSSNGVLKSILERLPIRWTETELAVGERRFDAGHALPLLIHPNPGNPNRYVALNSGFTFREYTWLNNARQTPKLPDWAVIDVRTPPNPLHPGKVLDADFFDEAWKVKPAGPR
jgi:dienelactone hydrolase